MASAGHTKPLILTAQAAHVADFEAAFGQSSPLHQHAPLLDVSKGTLDRLRAHLRRRGRP